MQNHEFERQVQERMEQIKFTPSDTVWAGVEKNLKQRRKRRIAFVWFFFLCLLAAGGAWWAYSPASFDKKNTTISNTEALKNNQSATETNKENTADKTTAEKNTAQPDENKTSNTQQNNAEKNKIVPAAKNADRELTAVQKSNKLAPHQSVALNSPISQSSKKYLPSDRKNGRKEKVAPQKNNNKIQPVTEVDDVNIDVIAGSVASINNGKDVKPETTTAVLTDSVVTPKTIIAKTGDLQKDSAVVTAPTIKVPKKSKWQFGVTTSAGVTNITEGVSAQKSYSNAAFVGSNFSAPGPLQNVGNLYVYPSELQPGTSFSIGVAARKKIKKRLSLSVGVQYHYYSNSLQVGRKLDSLSSALSGASYLAAGPRVTDHHNSYHFIELPVSVEWQLLKTKPLYLNAGFLLGQLLSSDALTYDNSRGIYFSDQNNLNKTQLNLRAGLAWSFWDKKPVSLQVGPAFQYGVSNLAKKSINGSNHLYTLGIDARILFRRK